MEQLIDVPDSVRASFEDDFGHSPPYTKDELASLKVFVAHNLRTAELLEYMHNIRALGITGCDFKSVSFINQMPNLRDFEVRYSAVNSIEPLRGREKIVDVNLKSCKVEDLEPLLTLPRLNSVSAIGCPLNERSFYEILPQLRTTPKLCAFGTDRFVPPRVTASSEEEWLLTCELHRRGLPISFHNNHSDGRTFIGCTSMEFTDKPHWTGVEEMSAKLLRELLKRPDLSVPMLLQEGKLYLDRLLVGEEE